MKSILQAARRSSQRRNTVRCALHDHLSLRHQNHRSIATTFDSNAKRRNYWQNINQTGLDSKPIISRRRIRQSSFCGRQVGGLRIYSSEKEKNHDHQSDQNDDKNQHNDPQTITTINNSSPDVIRPFNVNDDSDSKWLINQNLSTFIEGHGKDGFKSSGADFSVCFLGTGAGRSSSKRGSSCTALRWSGVTYLVDCGEGAEMKVGLSNVNKTSIKKIFVTHMHADHIFGLPSLLLGIQESASASFKETGSRQKRPVVKIYGPVGLYNYIAATISLSYAELKALTVEVYELRGGSRHWVHPGTYKNFGEFQHRSLHRRSIPCNQDGTWTLEVADELRNEKDASSASRSQLRGLNIVAAQVNHISKMQCFGFMVQEPHTQLRKIDVEKAKALGVKPSPKYKMLKAGFPVMNDDETREVLPDEVTLPAIPPRKAVFLGDCKGIPLPMAALCQNADLLVHEATLMENDPKVDRSGHSTAAMAGFFADYAKVRVLALNHISQSVQKSVETCAALLAEARNAIKGPTQVQLSYDFMEIEIPRGGFASSSNKELRGNAAAKSNGS